MSREGEGDERDEPSVEATGSWDGAASTPASPSLGSPSAWLPEDALRAGDRVAGFRIERRLGAGGMGEVYAATKLDTGERVALKRLGRTSATNLYRFKREFRALADVRHENLVTLHELHIPSGEHAFFTMELVEGRPFVAYVRQDAPAGEAPELARLEAALRQLVAGVHHLHGLRFIHRDLKPSNVLVTLEGRVVVLDFGLVSEASMPEPGITHQGQILGTPAYMAPEQAHAEAGPAADYYALGVMLYEALTGRLPFSGAALRIIMLKQDAGAPDPRREAAGVPDALGELCMRLLDRDPELRPSGRELLDLLDHRRAGSDESGRHEPDTREERRIPFVGRARELGVLSTALRDVVEGDGSITVHVQGPSGHGKSALLERFVAHARSEAGALLLTGRCLVRESVAYKGVDAVVDALSVHLRRMPRAELAELAPRHIGPLTRLFPVLAGIWEGDEGSQGPPAAAFEPAELRRLGLSALRDLLVRLARRRPLVVCVDDVQWSNVDGIDLLTWVMRPPSPPPLLLVLAFREPGPDDEVLRLLTDPAALEARDVRTLEVGPLSREAAMELARALADAEGKDERRLSAIVGRAEGSPFFIGQMVADEQPVQDVAVGLDRIVAHRFAELEPEARRALECVAVAGGPVSTRVVLEALDDPGVEASLERLGALGLIRWRHPTGDDAQLLVDTSHARIREVALDQLDPEGQRRLHLGLAAVLERHGGHPEALADHYARGGEPARAVVHVQRAAERAAQMLAFARAVELHRRALALLPAEADAAQREGLSRALADQLANLGRGAEAAELLLGLAAAAAPAKAQELRREAARQLIRCGRIDESVELLAELLEAIGEPFPRTRRAAILMFLRERLRLRLRGWSYQRRERSEVPPQLLVRLDTLLTLITGGQEVLLSAALHSRALPLALDAGEPRLLGMAFGSEILIQAGSGNFARARQLCVECQELAASVGDTELELATEMNIAYFELLSYRPQRARRRLAGLLPRLDEAPGVGWMRGNVTARWMEQCITTGHHAEVRRELPTRLAIARERGNLHEIASLEAYAASLAILYDDLEVARRHLAAARATWTSTHYGFSSLVLDTSEAQLLVSVGELDAARRHIERVGVDLRRWGMHRFRMCVDVYERHLVRCLLEMALREPAHRGLTARVQRICRRWHRASDPLVRGEAMLDLAAIHTLEGDVEAARRLWRRAEDHFDDLGMRAHLAAVRTRLAAVTRGHESTRFAAQADEHFAVEGVERRERFVDWYAPAAVRGVAAR